LEKNEEETRKKQKKRKKRKKETNPKKPIGRSFSQILATKYEYKNYKFKKKTSFYIFGSLLEPM